MPNRMDVYDEVWAEIDGTNGGYFISSYGRVFSKSRVVRFGNRIRHTKSKILTPRPHSNGYKGIIIYGKNKFIHRLVASAFLENSDNLPEVNHKNEDKADNRVENLEWCSKSYNTRYGTGIERANAKRLKDKKVKNIETGKIYFSPIEAFRQTGIHNDSITRVCNGKSKTAGGYHWEYIREAKYGK